MRQKEVILGVSGGIAAYKSAELVRQFVRQGWGVQVVMTAAATRFIGPMTMQALSGRPVFTDPWDNRIPDHMPHIELSKGKNGILIAPASADCLSKLAHGAADDLLSALCLARECPLLVAPAMNARMWAHPATQRNIAQLKSDGVIVMEPETGALACGDTGAGRMPDPAVLLEFVEYALSPKLLAGKRVLVTAGPTIEPVDPVRAITNRSSGKMGYAVAHAAAAAGASVVLISGPTYLSKPIGVSRIAVTTAREMYAAVMSEAGNADIFFSIAAVADYHVRSPASLKIKRTSHACLTLSLEPNPDILAEVAQLPNAPYCVGFAAETDHWLENGTEKRERKGVPMMVVNNALEAIGADDNRLTILEAENMTTLGPAAKSELAIDLVKLVATRLERT